MVLPLLVAVGLFAILLLHFAGRRERILTPIAIFVLIEVVATWPALASESLRRGSAEGWPLALLTATATLTAVVAYVLVGGARVSAARWRDARHVPDRDRLRALASGTWLLVAVLVVLSLWRAGGLPSMLTGGLSSLLDPLTHADEVAEIRETRRLLTKGYLAGESYQGQGLLNAFTEAGWQVAVVAAVLRHGWSRSRSSLVQLIAVGVMCLLFLGSMGQRSPLLLAFVAGVGAALLLWRMPARRLVALGAAGVILLLFISPLAKGATGGTGLLERQQAMVDRITDGNGQNTVAIVDLVDAGLLETRNGGLFVDRTLVMVPGAPVGEPFALTLTRLAHGGSENTTGFSTATNFGHLYVDGKETGVLLGYLVLGAVMGLVWRRLVKLSSPVGAVVQVQGAVLLGYMSVIGLQGLVAGAAMAALAVAVLVVPQLLDPRRPSPARAVAARPGDRAPLVEASR